MFEHMAWTHLFFRNDDSDAEKKCSDGCTYIEVRSHEQMKSNLDIIPGPTERTPKP